jgi:hypothetical protein
MTKLIALLCVLALGCGAELPPDYYYEEAEIGELEQAISVASNYGENGDTSPVNSDSAGCGTAPYDTPCYVPYSKVFDVCFKGNTLPDSFRRQLTADTVALFNSAASGTGFFMLFHDGLCNQQPAWTNVIRIAFQTPPFPAPSGSLGNAPCNGSVTSGSFRRCWIRDVYVDWDAIATYTSSWGVSPAGPRKHVLLHEFGHAAGLEHNHNSSSSTKLMNSGMYFSNYPTLTFTSSQTTAMSNFVP